jgi:hypothetical protein
MALEAAQTIDRSLALEAGDARYRFRRLSIHVLLLTENHLRHHRPTVRPGECRRYDIQPAQLATAVRAVLAVATDPQRRVDCVSGHSQQLLKFSHVSIGRNPTVPSGQRGGRSYTARKTASLTGKVFRSALIFSPVSDRLDVSDELSTPKRREIRVLGKPAFEPPPAFAAHWWNVHRSVAAGRSPDRARGHPGVGPTSMAKPANGPRSLSNGRLIWHWTPPYAHAEMRA